MAMVGGGENLESHNLRHFLRIKDDDRRTNLNQSTSSNGGGSGRRSPSSLTLNAILSEKRAPPARSSGEPPLQPIQSNRTLLDIIREDQTSGFGVRDRRDGRRSWRQLREKIRLRTGAGGSSTVHIPASDVPINNNDNNYNNRTMMMTRRHSSRFDPIINSAESSHPGSGPSFANGRLGHNYSSAGQQLTSGDNRRPHEHEEEEMEELGAAAMEEDDGAAEQPVRMSLMALLAENDRQMGVKGSNYVMEEEEEDVAADEDGAAVAISGYSCCVCMVRHKGAAFIPCGHTFCRLCSRELWVQRGNCPLCNHYILEVLDIF